jgi:crotonobetainyl-CoA:carnitine CoA-transferase CaiB-like acyl-CoA transferase
VNGTGPLADITVVDLTRALAGPYTTIAGVIKIERLDQAEVLAGRIRLLDEVYPSPQVEHLGLDDVAQHPTLGEIRLPGSPLSYSRSGKRAAEAPPVLGQNNSEVFDGLED